MENNTEFHIMQEVPRVQKDCSGVEEPYSESVFIYSEDFDMWTIGWFNFDMDEWSHSGEESMKLTCWCYPPSPIAFIKDRQPLAVTHTGYVE
jgi:hypothetical protein